MPKVYVGYFNNNGDCDPPSVAFIFEYDAKKWLEEQDTVYCDYIEVELIGDVMELL